MGEAARRFATGPHPVGLRLRARVAGHVRAAHREERQRQRCDGGVEEDRQPSQDEQLFVPVCGRVDHRGCGPRPLAWVGLPRGDGLEQGGGDGRSGGRGKPAACQQDAGGGREHETGCPRRRQSNVLRAANDALREGALGEVRLGGTPQRTSTSAWPQTEQPTRWNARMTRSPREPRATWCLPSASDEPRRIIPHLVHTA